MNTGLIVLIVVGVIILLLVFYFIATYNNLIGLRNRVKDQLAQIDVQLKKRFDLIPNLVETVKGYATHEKETLDSVIKARNSFLAAETPQGEIDASNMLTSAISKLFALSEAYPDLKANTNFQTMQQDLKEIENAIASARTFYNDTVLMLNNKIEMFPSNIVASMFKFNKEAFFETAKEERENIQVKF